MHKSNKKKAIPRFFRKEIANQAKTTKNRKDFPEKIITAMRGNRARLR